MQPARDLIRPIPTAAELVAAARRLVPRLMERAAQDENDRRIAAATIAEMKAAGLFRALQPKRWGGYEVDLATYYDIQMTLAEGDMSVAWVYGVIGVTAWVMALLDDRAARDIWGTDSSSLVAISLAPSGEVIDVDGGVRLTGRWRYASGSAHCDWAFVGAAVAPASAAGPGARPEWRMYLVPKSDYVLVDTWFTSGLKATGSNDIVIDGAFVPDYRMRHMRDNIVCTGNGQVVNTAALYRIPFGQVFGGGVAYGAIGALQGMLDAFRAYAQSRVRLTGSKTVEDPDAQLVAAEAETAIDELKALVRRNAGNLTAYAERGEIPPPAERLKYKYQMATFCERCRSLAVRIFQATGASGILAQHPFGRILADITAGRQHITNQPELYGREWGAHLLGRPITEDLMQ